MRDENRLEYLQTLMVRFSQHCIGPTARLSLTEVWGLHCLLSRLLGD